MSKPFIQWTSAEVTEYLHSKNILIDTEYSGALFMNVKLKTLRELFGVELGDKIYLAIREQVEEYMEQITPVSSLSNSSVLSSLHNSPTVTSVLDFPEERLVDMVENYLEKKSKLEDAMHTIEQEELRRFISEEPPLLWRDEHVKYLLRSMNLDDNISIPVDKFIFMSAAEYDKLYPTKGLKLYLTIRSKFVDPTILP